MPDTLIVYYSLTGNSDLIANSISSAIDCDVVKLKPVNKINPSSFTRFLIGGFQARIGAKPELEDIEKNPNDYDLVILGMPVWAWTVNPIIRSFLDKHDLSGKNIAIWLTAAGDGLKAMEKLESELKNSKIVNKIVFQEPLQNNPEQAKIDSKDWAKSLKIN